MKKNARFLSAAAICLATAAFADTSPSPAPSAPGSVLRVWHDTQGRSVEATFRGLENGQVYLQTANGVVAAVPLERLTAEDQEIASHMKPEGLGIPTDPYLPSYAKKIDEIVGYGLKAKGVQPNALASDEQFCRRVYLDLVGRIPTREEAMEFLADTSSSKRAKVIDKLINSDGFNARMFNYFGDMLRMTDDAQKAKFFTYEEWFKAQLRTNRPYNEIIYDMMTADGKLLENGASGYLLRDKGMRLDNLSITLSTFIGANVACAQCHDHPFADWTQRQFYQMAAFFGTTETYDKGSYRGSPGLRKELTQEEMKKARRLFLANALDVHQIGHNEVKLPDDYRYADGKPGDMITPRLLTWSPKTDARLLLLPNPADRIKLENGLEGIYREADAEIGTLKKPSNNVKGSKNSKVSKVSKSSSYSTGTEKDPRIIFAKWLTSPQNPRFAMTIANRLWKLMFGVAVKEPVTDLDDPTDSNNPMLLGHLANEMVRLKFDLRAFMRLLCNTQTYQREAATKELTPGEPYYFPGPILRRMTAEQAWDSCVTLAIGDKVDSFKLLRAQKYSNIMDLKGKVTASEVRAKLEDLKGAGREFAAGKAGKPGKGGKARMMKDTDEDEVDATKPQVLQGLVLARASELPQPEKDQHFLRMFGQSDRQIADTDTDEGSIPQVLMLMNGEAQSVLRNPKSLVFSTAMKESSPEKQVESLYMSFFTRHPTDQELKDAKDALAGGMSVADLTWVLFNSREFVFVQ